MAQVAAADDADDDDMCLSVICLVAHCALIFHVLIREEIQKGSKYTILTLNNSMVWYPLLQCVRAVLMLIKWSCLLARPFVNVCVGACVPASVRACERISAFMLFCM